MAWFQRKDFPKAKDLFQQAAGGTNREMAHAARMHAHMCERRLVKSQAPALRTVEDFYNYGMALLNQGGLAEAERQLRKALGLKDDLDYVHYSLALCCGLQGQLEAAGKHLRRAIQIQPQNRNAARNDPDFHAIANQSPLREILFPEADKRS